MFEKFSPRVEGVVKHAHSIAREYDLEYVGTEHLLLSISHEGTGVGAKLLEGHGATYKKLKQEVDKLVQQSMEETWVFGRLPGTPHFKNVVASAIEAARELDSKEICTEHLLLALLKEEGSVAYNALAALGIRYKDLKNELASQQAR